MKKLTIRTMDLQNPGRGVTKVRYRKPYSRTVTEIEVPSVARPSALQPSKLKPRPLAKILPPAAVAISRAPAPAAVPVFMSTDSAVRKMMPVTSGCLKYFPDALLLVSFVSKVGNDKHNPGQPLHWAKEKSTDEPDCEVRHMLDYLRGDAADPGLEPLGELGHLASKAWRALAHLQRECDRVRKEQGK